MSRENAVVFIGHSECPHITVDILKAEIEKLIKNYKVTDFYNGGQGHFDRTAALAVHQLKEQYPQIKNYLVIPYRNFNVYDVVHEHPDITVHLTLFHAKITEGTIQLLEHNAVAWITPVEIPNYAFCPADKDINNTITSEYKE